MTPLTPAETWAVLLLLFSIVAVGVYVHADYRRWERQWQARREALARRRHPSNTTRHLTIVRGHSHVS